MSRVLAAVLLAAGFAGAEAPAKQPDKPPACPPVESKRTGAWQDVHLREFSLSLPACFTSYEDPKQRFVHGGLLWRCEKRKADLAWGMWGTSSFGASWKLCSTTIAGIPVLLGRSETDEAVDLMAWYRTGSVHEPVLSAWSPKPAPLAEMTAIVASGRKGP